MKSHTMLLIYVLSLLGLTACGGTMPVGEQHRPDWVDGESRRYPAEQYLLGVGMARSLEGAKDRARVDLAKVFEVAVSEQGQDIQRFERSEEGGITSEKSQQQVHRQITLKTDEIIRGVEIADVWQDDSGQYHALAVLQRHRAAARLRQEIKKLDEATDQHIRTARGLADSMAKVAAAQRALQLQLDRTGYQRSLQIVDITGRGVPPKWSLAELESDLNDILSRVYFRPQVVGQSDQPLLEILSGALSESGFRVVIDAPANYILRGHMALDNVVLKDGWYWLRGNLELTLIATDGTALGTQRFPIKASATQDAVVHQRLMLEIESLLKKQLRATVMGFFNKPLGTN